MPDYTTSEETVTSWPKCKTTLISDDSPYKTCAKGKCIYPNLQQPPENKMSEKKKYFTTNFTHLIHKACQTPFTFTNQCHCLHLQSVPSSTSQSLLTSPSSSLPFHNISPSVVYKHIFLYTGCFMTLGHNCRRWFPRSLWWKKFI